ncbi:DUF1553 domain-containing protein [Thalassoglobus polymorphus]|uniref:Planctomycete cytochrome C n=1 Tax=Thalassoglobus polymorphus TaxID=2527994 RepID=A0A517QGQ4_9PLAN|nr:DUF1553 domain-containing protein [Thalassoglobus polymorphus]QDT30818.1 Planctomycete cytochrome C [Thalassoglobus polymorphus]
MPSRLTPLSSYRIAVIVFFSLSFQLLGSLAKCHAEDEGISASEAGLDFFEKKIRPVLVEHCYECHSADSKIVRGGLLVDSAEAFRKGGDSGESVVPGKPGEGTLLDALKHETFEMPPKQKLPEQVISDFETWIAMGAPDPRKATLKTAAKKMGMDLETGRQFWSFKPLQKVALPKVQFTDWPQSKIDQFILAKQEEQGLRPGADAGDLTLLRRLYFDLTGLPPSVEQVQAFQSNQSDARWAEVIDELLASKNFGEHWGRYWLDLARYSESTGGGRSLLYRESWRYRNYVIDSFNGDKPYDTFILEQIAGDLLEAEEYKQRQQQIVATAFLALGPHNYENQDKEQLRMDIVDEQIDTTGRVFLGMTIGCARCHDHKFDPIPTSDYYALAGIFRSTNSLVDGNVSRWVSTPLPQSQEQTDFIRAHESNLAETNQALRKLQARMTQLKVGLPAILVDTDQATLVGEWTESQSVKGYVGENYRHSSDLTSSATYDIPVQPGLYEVQLSYTPASNRTRKAKVTVQHAEGEKEFLINQQLTPSEDGTFHSLGEFEVQELLTVQVRPTEMSPTIIDAVRLISKSDLNGELAEKLQKELAEANVELTALQAKLKKLEANAPEKPPLAVSVEEMEKAEDYFVCIRGNVHNLGEPVKRGFLSVIQSSETAPLPADASGRLEFANWIASPENPLTARVFVNRVWHSLFGVGLVRTVDNFGVPGETPSHPELLDFLANEFIENGWSMKKLIRQIVLTRTYQLDSTLSSVSGQDPENRYLTHQNRKRLRAESIHDSLLSMSGELDPTPAGNSMRPGTRSEYGYKFDFGKRAVYLPVFRNRLPDLFTVFDFPDPNLSQGRRTSSTVSPQSLFLMNSEFVHIRSEETAKRVLAIEGDVPQRIEWLILTTLNRYPTSDEQRLFGDFLGEDPESLEAWSQVCQVLFGSLDFRFVD